MEFRKGTFQILTATDVKSYEGFTNGEEWNGHACPVFSFEVAKQILKDTKTKEYPAHYSSKKDMFRYKFDEGEYDEFGPKTIKFNGEEIKVYELGTKYWIWEEVEEKQN